MRRPTSTPIDNKTRVPLARLAGEGGARRSFDGRVWVGAPAPPNGTAAAPTLTRLAPLATLSRQAGEGFVEISRLISAPLRSLGQVLKDEIGARADVDPGYLDEAIAEPRVAA